MFLENKIFQNIVNTRISLTKDLKAINDSLGAEGICQVRKGILAEKHSEIPLSQKYSKNESFKKQEATS
jgi:hypothetical protein